MVPSFREQKEAYLRFSSKRTLLSQTSQILSATAMIQVLWKTRLFFEKKREFWISCLQKKNQSASAVCYTCGCNIPVSLARVSRGLPPTCNRAVAPLGVARVVLPRAASAAMSCSNPGAPLVVSLNNIFSQLSLRHNFAAWLKPPQTCGWL